MSRAHSCLVELQRASVILEPELITALEESRTHVTQSMYDMLRYFMGYLDEQLVPTEAPCGKRFRPSLSILIAEDYDAVDAVLPAAVSIELFHNFSLIHDDIQDQDEVRRGRPTVWKLWGVNQAINAGDAQSIIAARWAVRAGSAGGSTAVSDALLKACLEVAEGQYLDFMLASASLEDDTWYEQTYLTMIEKKTGALVRISTEAAGFAGHKEEKERALLRAYGLNLGVAYQISDDYRSIWASSATTGKDRYGDIRERKRALPFLYAYQDSDADTRTRLHELYSQDRQLTSNEIDEVLTAIQKTSARTRVSSAIQTRALLACEAAQALTLGREKKELLIDIVNTLVFKDVI